MYAKSYPVYDKYIHGLKTNILEQIIHVSASLWLGQQTDKGAGRSSWGVFLTRYQMSLETAVNVPHFYQNIVVKSYIVFYIFHFQRYINSYDSFNKEYVYVIWLSPKCSQCELCQLW